MAKEAVTIEKLVAALMSIRHDAPDGKSRCTSPEAKELTLAQKRAMHVFLHETLAALNRLYTVVPKQRADFVINIVLAPLGQGTKSKPPKKA